MIWHDEARRALECVAEAYVDGRWVSAGVGAVHLRLRRVDMLGDAHWVGVLRINGESVEAAHGDSAADAVARLLAFADDLEGVVSMLRRFERRREG